MAWETGEIFRVSPNASLIFYPRLTDNAGNITVVNSDGVIVYQNSEAVDTGIGFVKTASDDMTARVRLNSNADKTAIWA